MVEQQPRRVRRIIWTRQLGRLVTHTTLGNLFCAPERIKHASGRFISLRSTTAVSRSTALSVELCQLQCVDRTPRCTGGLSEHGSASGRSGSMFGLRLCNELSHRLLQLTRFSSCRAVRRAVPRAVLRAACGASIVASPWRISCLWRITSACLVAIVCRPNRWAL